MVTSYSIIIPHYNIPELLGRCLRSIPERDDIQVIVVDDCSPCQAQLNELVPELTRSNIELYSTPVGGSAGCARNVGIDHACGRWLTFLDADDLFVDNIEEIFDANVNRSEDILYFRTRSLMGDNLNEKSSRSDLFEDCFQDYFKEKNEEKIRYCFVPLWGKFIQRELIINHKIRCDEVPYSNDVRLSVFAGHYAHDIFVSEETAYIVTERRGSLTAIKQNVSQDIKERIIRYKVNYGIYRDLRKDKKTWMIDYKWNLMSIYHANKAVWFREWLKLPLYEKYRVLRNLIKTLFLS